MAPRILDKKERKQFVLATDIIIMLTKVDTILSPFLGTRFRHQNQYLHQQHQHIHHEHHEQQYILNVVRSDATFLHLVAVRPAGSNFSFNGAAAASVQTLLNVVNLQLLFNFS